MQQAECRKHEQDVPHLVGAAKLQTLLLLVVPLAAVTQRRLVGAPLERSVVAESDVGLETASL